MPVNATCQMTGCPYAAVVFVSFGPWNNRGASLCDYHKPTVEQALRRGVVVDEWTIHGCYPHEIAAKLTFMTGHKIREATVRADLKWLGLTEKDRAAEARVGTAVALGEAGPNVVALRRRP